MKSPDEIERLTATAVAELVAEQREVERHNLAIEIVNKLGEAWGN